MRDNVGTLIVSFRLITMHPCVYKQRRAPQLTVFQVTLSNDMVSDGDQLLEKVIGGANLWGGTNYTAALQTVQTEMESTWASDRLVLGGTRCQKKPLTQIRSPVVIFLSDGECDIEDTTVYDLCRSASRLGCVVSHTFYYSSPEHTAENHSRSMQCPLVKMCNRIIFAEWPRLLAKSMTTVPSTLWLLLE